MRVTRIIIDRREYSLPDESSVEAIMGRITEQVRAGGGFIELVGAPRRAVNVLVSPGTNLSIEVTEVEEESTRPQATTEHWETSSLDPFELM